MAWLGAWLALALAAGGGGEVTVDALRSAVKAYDGAAVHRAPALTDAQLQQLRGHHELRVHWFCRR